MAARVAAARGGGEGGAVTAGAGMEAVMAVEVTAAVSGGGDGGGVGEGGGEVVA